MGQLQLHQAHPRRRRQPQLPPVRRQQHPRPHRQQGLRSPRRIRLPPPFNDRFVVRGSFGIFYGLYNRYYDGTQYDKDSLYNTSAAPYNLPPALKPSPPRSCRISGRRPSAPTSSSSPPATSSPSTRSIGRATTTPTMSSGPSTPSTSSTTPSCSTSATSVIAAAASPARTSLRRAASHHRGRSLQLHRRCLARLRETASPIPISSPSTPANPTPTCRRTSTAIATDSPQLRRPPGPAHPAPVPRPHLPRQLHLVQIHGSHLWHQPHQRRAEPDPGSSQPLQRIRPLGLRPDQPHGRHLQLPGPRFHAARTMDWLLAGWTTSGVYQLASGFPFAVYGGVGTDQMAEFYTGRLPRQLHKTKLFRVLQSLGIVLRHLQVLTPTSDAMATPTRAPSALPTSPTSTPASASSRTSTNVSRCCCAPKSSTSVPPGTPSQQACSSLTQRSPTPTSAAHQSQLRVVALESAHHPTHRPVDFSIERRLPSIWNSFGLP